MRQAYRYTISSGLAMQKGIPRCFVAVQLLETARGAVYLYGHGASDPTGRCCQCGRTLTHPVSILVGIGPECGGHWWDESVLGPYGMTEAHIDRLRTMVTDRLVDTWIPKAAIKSCDPVDEAIAVPADHKMLQPKGEAPRPENGASTPTSHPTPTKTAHLDKGGKFLVARFPYDPKDVENIRRLEGRRWDSAKKEWTAWASQENINLLLSFGFSICPKLQAIIQPLNVKDVVVDEKALDLPGLYPFQLDGVKFLEARNGCGLIADEMGLGKTIQAIGWLKLHPELRPVFIVVPASLKLNWERELLKWLGEDTPVTILSGTVPNRGSLRKINIINYDILGSWMEVILASGPKAVVVDESHYIKNIKAQRTKAVRELVKACPHAIFLTGTPITNRPAEFFTTLNLLEPREFSSWFSYVKRYCGAFQGRFGWEIGGATHTDELHERLTRTVMIRRRKEDVLKDLPAKRRHVIPMDITNRREYAAAEADLLAWLREKFGKGKAEKAAGAEALARFSYLKQLAAEGAFDFQVSWIKDSLDSNGKLVIFAVHHATIDRLASELRHYNPVVVDGRVSIEGRQQAVDRFQTDPECRVFIGNIRAAGVGITLTASSNTVFCELGWTPGEHDQAEDRVHRIGQTESVSAWYLVASDTVMTEIAELLDEKRKVLDAVLDGKMTGEESMLTALLRNRLGE